MSPRTIKESSCYKRTLELCHHWRWDKGPRERKRRQTNIYNNSCLRINCLLTNSLAALMWRWYLNSDEAALQLLVGGSRGSRRCRWDRKRSPEPNLHVCGEDGMKGAVYNMKKEHAEKENGTEKEKREKNTEKRRKGKIEKRTLWITKENNRCANFGPSIYVRVNLFNISQLT